MKSHVLGLGKSLSEYSGKQDGEITIGVNDIFRFHKTDYLVCVDRQERFEKSRMHQICMSTPEILFSQHKVWEEQSLAKKFIQLRFDKPRGDISNLGETFFFEAPMDANILPIIFSCPHSISSPFVAACIAYKLGATEIKLYGCDYTHHPVLFEQRKIERVKKDFAELKKVLNEKGVKISCSTGSALSGIL